MSRITPCLWFKDQAEEAARFYVGILPDSRIDKVHKSSIDTPGPRAGQVLMVEFTLAGQKFQALNGGIDAEYNLSVSMSFEARDQAELDEVWNALLDAAGRRNAAGWPIAMVCTGRFSIRALPGSWPIRPRRRPP